MDKKYEPLLHKDYNMCINDADYEEADTFYYNHRDAFWTEHEIVLSADIKDFEKLTDDERRYLKIVLAFFAHSDFIVNDNLLENIANVVKPPQVKRYYNFQVAMEDVHSLTYLKILQTLVTDGAERQQLLNAITEIEPIKDKAEWCRRYQNYDCGDPVVNFVTVLVAFSAVEGIFFSSSFATIFWLKSRQLMPGLSHANEFISRDESLHQDFACYLYKKIINKLPEERVIEIINEAVELEIAFARNAIGSRLNGINPDTMSQYIKFVANRLLYSLIGRKIYNVVNPYNWMNRICLERKGNIFERPISEYPMSGSHNLEISDDF